MIKVFAGAFRHSNEVCRRFTDAQKQASATRRSSKGSHRARQQRAEQETN